MSKAVTTKGSNETVNYDPSVLGAVEDVSAEDISIGRLAVMSSSSNLVKEDRAKQGAIVDIETGEQLGYKDEEPLEIVILKSFKYWVEKNGDDFVARYPATSPNEKAWEEGPIKRVFHHAFLVLLPAQIKDGVEMPYELAFRSTDLATAKKISKMLLGLGRQKKASWSQKFLIKAVNKKKGPHSWWGTDVAPGETTTEQEVSSAYSWFMQLNQADVNSGTSGDY